MSPMRLHLSHCEYYMIYHFLELAISDYYGTAIIMTMVDLGFIFVFSFVYENMIFNPFYFS